MASLAARVMASIGLSVLGKDDISWGSGTSTDNRYRVTILNLEGADRNCASQ